MNDDQLDKYLDEQTTQLPNEIQPQRDLWSGIERAIHNKEQAKSKKNNSYMPTAWAASLIAAVLITWLAFTPELETVGELLTKSNDQQIVPGQLVSLMQKSFKQQKQAMLVSFGQPNISNLPQEMQTQLQQLAFARHAIEKALLADEDNTDLLNLLRFTQQQELNLLQQLYSPQWQSI